MTFREETFREAKLEKPRTRRRTNTKLDLTGIGSWGGGRRLDYSGSG